MSVNGTPIDMARAKGCAFLDLLERKPGRHIAIKGANIMEWRMIDRLAERPEGSYERDPVGTYRRLQENLGTCAIDQWIPTNPLSLREHGYESGKAGGSATTGKQEIVVDGVRIDSPEAVIEHLEGIEFPRLRQKTTGFDAEAVKRQVLDGETRAQAEMGDRLLKVPYSWPFPALGYYRYGYEHYFCAYALFPDVMERHFKLQADYAALHNRAGAAAIREAGLPLYSRLDHDMADGRGTLVDILSLDRLWFPHFERAIRPLLDAGFTLIWHCDGNLMPMVPRLLEVGLKGFQGFQYEFGMDYEKICRLRDRDGEELLIWAGVSVTTTLPRGTPADVRREMDWLVAKGPRRGLGLGCSSSVVPGVPWENLRTLQEGFRHYAALQA